jgi:hypothetical protein
MINTAYKIITLLIGSISFVFVTGLGLILTTVLLITGIIARPFLLKHIQDKGNQPQAYKVNDAVPGQVYEGKYERVDQ